MNCCDKSLTKPLLGRNNNTSNNNKRRHRKRRKSSINNNSGSGGENGYYTDEFDLDPDPQEGFGIQFATMTNRGCGMTCRRIYLLLWKNFLFRKRHYIVTALEIILPTLFAMLLAYLRTQVPETITIPTSNATFFPRVNETVMMDHVGSALTKYCTDCLVAYAPKNNRTDSIMKELKNSIRGATFNLKGFDSDGEIELLISEIALNRSSYSSDLKAAIIFEDGLDKFPLNDFPVGHKISYKIRLVDEIKNTGELFPWFQFPGPDRHNAENYWKVGFSGLQITLDRILTKLLTGKVPIQQINVQVFPYPPFVQSFDFTQVYFVFLPQFLVLGFIFIVPSIIRNVVSEKETGIKELMKMMGLPNWMHWLGWMLNSMLILMLSITIVICLFFMTFNSETGPFLVYGDPTLWWFVLCLYAMSATSFCFFVSTLFQRPTLATTVGIVLWLVSYYAVAIPLDSKYQNLSLFEKMSAALVPNMAFHLVIKAMSALEGKAVGARWSNIADPINSLDELSVGLMCLMFIVDTILYMSLTVYFENIVPSEFGVRKSWYYIFKPSTWCPGGKINVSPETSRASSAEGSPGFEAEPSLTLGIIIQNLTKRFGTNKVAVDKVSLKMYDGQITALLGHNGAGKTTTMSVLTGMFGPTSGTAIVNGYDIATQMDLVRSSLGLCPQHNMLFDKLTVEEHLVFFGRLKGLTSGQAHTEMKSLLEKLQLREKRNALSLSLSGGQKRKLSLGLALIGGTKVVILDEPTSGMDPEARRAIWDILLEMRGQRTIVLTTHFMEEADVLGDRIAIMAAGKIKCCGTPMYLKRFYGTGYTLRMTVEPGSPVDLIVYSVQKHVPTAALKSQQFSNASEIAITLPSGAQSTSLFPPMFADLEENKRNLGILTIGLSLTTMDEVFVKVGELTHADDLEDEQDAKTEKIDPSKRHGPTGVRTSLHLEPVKGVPLILEQIWALLLKRYIYTVRKRKLFLSQFMMPLLLLIAAILLSNRSFHPSPTPPARRMTLSDYKNARTLYTYGDETLGKNYASVVGSSAKYIKENLTGTLLDVGDKDLGAYRALYVVGADLNTSSVSAMFSSIPHHASPVAINLVTNTLLKTISPDKNYRIDVTNHPLENGLSSVIEAAQPNPTFSSVVPILFGVFVPIGLALFAASYIVFPVEEKLCKAKQLQLMTGVSPALFWGASFLWDFCVMAILISFMVLCFPIFQSFGAFTAYGGAGVIYLILLVYGFSAISFSYLCSTFVATVPGGFSFVTMVHILTGMIMSLVVYLLENAELGEHTVIVRHIGRFFPTFSVSLCMMRFTSISTKNSRCNILPEKFKTLLCNSAYTVGPELRQCCPNCADFPGAQCFQPEPYIEWSYQSGGYDIPGIGQDLLYLFLVGILYKCLVLLIEYGVVHKILDLIFKSSNSTFTTVSNDEDVQAETQRAQTLVHTGRIGDDALVVDGICKSYGSFAAVSNLSFAVHHGECFGLLGVNGAGKTTTFRILTGDEIRSSGNAYSLNCTLERNRKKFLANIGYCPQFDGIVGVLTGREMLELFCRLRGVPKGCVGPEADKWLYKMGLYESRNVQCQKYSGGMKRRLSACMALIGDPPIILLDEPTSGVDPVARRQFWNVISEVRDSGQAVILTSHSMEECEALCNRLGIMVNGQFQCFGGVQHLKNKFAQGFSLVLKLKPLIQPESPELRSLKADISVKFNPCVLKDQHQNVLNYQVFNTNIPWDVMFRTMEDLKIQYIEVIEDYAVNETTLEEVFLSFARKQYSNREANVSLFKKLITCQCWCCQ